MKIKKRIFLDYAASTPCDERAVKAMEQYWNNDFGNAGGIYLEGVVAKRALDESRKQIAEFISARKEEILFTSGGTESNNLAIFGVIAAIEKKGTALKDIHIISSTIEHPSVLDVFKELEVRGVDVSYINVNEKGLIDPKDVTKALKTNTTLVSLSYVNNEIGTVQPILQISKLLRNLQKPTTSKMALPFFHTDASQAPLYLNCDVNRLGVDMMTIDAQKFYGPKGVGFLYKKRGVEIESLFKGGGQEGGLRPGTENVPLIVGFAKAFEIAIGEREKENKRLSELRDYFINKLLENITSAELNGDENERIPNNINISIPGTDSEFLVIKLDVEGISAGTRSACLSHEDRGSYVVKALGKSEAHSNSTLRFTLGRNTTKKELDFVVSVLKNCL